MIGFEDEWSIECVTERTGDGTIATDNGTSIVALDNFLSAVEVFVISACGCGCNV